MSCSVLPCAFCLGRPSRMSFSLSLEFSPDCQRLLQRVIEAGIGLFACQVPFANWAKSVQGSTLRSRSLGSTPCMAAWEKANAEQRTTERKTCRMRIKISGSRLVISLAYAHYFRRRCEETESRETAQFKPENCTVSPNGRSNQAEARSGSAKSSCGNASATRARESMASTILFASLEIPVTVAEVIE